MKPDEPAQGRLTGKVDSLTKKLASVCSFASQNSINLTRTVPANVLNVAGESFYPWREFLPLEGEFTPRREFFQKRKIRTSLKPANEALKEAWACNGLPMVESSNFSVVGFDLALFQAD